MNIITEIVNLKTINGITDEEFIQIVDELECEFHSKQGGFIDSELVKTDKADNWMIIQHWKSKEEASLASKKMFEEKITERFRNALDPQNVKIMLLPQIKSWKL